MGDSGRRRARSEKRRDLAALSAFSLFFAVCFSKLWRRGQTCLLGDALVYLYPLRTVAWRQLWNGQLPLWTPAIFSGYPLLSMAQLGIGYPLTWLHIFVSPNLAVQIYVLAPYLLAPVFTYAYARQINRSRTASMIAGLCFGYGGLMVSLISMNGLLSNAEMWAPLALTAMERSRQSRFIPCLLGGTAACSMSVLSGTGQGFVFVGILMLAYGCFVAIYPAGEGAEGDAQPGWLESRRWRPLATATGAVTLSAGVAAFQIMETLQAVRHSVRNVLTYETFTEGSLPFNAVWRSFSAPVYYLTDVNTYVAPVALGLAVYGGSRAWRMRCRDPRPLVWSVIAVIAVVLMFGGNSPLYRLVYYIPGLNFFRGPVRHTFEWTFAIAILSAYGWDALETRARAGELLKRCRNPKRQILVIAVLAATSLVIAAAWYMAVAPREPVASDDTFPRLVNVFVLWKGAFVFATVLALFQARMLCDSQVRPIAIAVVLAFTFLVEPFITISTWWDPLWWGADSPTAENSRVPPSSTRWLRQFSPEQNRVYTRVDLFIQQFGTPPLLDAGDLSAVHGLQNVAGYEPLIFSRYSRALGNVTFDGVNPREGFSRDPTLLGSSSRVLDVLNTTFVVGFSGMATSPAGRIEDRGISFTACDADLNIEPGRTVSFAALEPAPGDTLALVTALGFSTGEEQGSVIAKLRIVTDTGDEIEREIRAGIETAEWAHERPDVRAIIHHSLAPVFNGRRPESEDDLRSMANRYLARIALGERMNVRRVDVQNLSRTARLIWSKATVYDTQSARSSPLPCAAISDERWEPVYDEDGVLIIRNRHAMPRAWLVREAESVTEADALLRLRGESQRPFDPARTVLLEAGPAEIPALPGGAIGPGEGASVVEYGPNRLVIASTALSPAILVLSEINYPGWLATVDGKPARVFAADYLLRGVALTAGEHRIEIHYSAPGAMKGIVVSILTLTLLTGMALYVVVNRRRRTGQTRLRELSPGE